MLNAKNHKRRQEARTKREPAPISPASAKVKASRIRRKQAEKKATPEDAQWLSNYESARFKPKSAPVALPPREQLHLPAPVVHTTKPTDAIPGDADTFVPKVNVPTQDPNNPDAPPTADDGPILPEPVDEAAREANAAKVAALITMLIAAGVESATRMANAKQFPGASALIAMGATSQDAREGFLAYLNKAATRLVLKYEVTSAIPYEDELLVGAALLGSAVAVVAERKLLASGAETAEIVDEKTEKKEKPDEKTTPKPEVKVSFGERRLFVGPGQLVSK